MPPYPAVDYSGVIPDPNQELVMARYLSVAYGVLLLTLAGASAYELCSENTLSSASIYVLR